MITITTEEDKVSKVSRSDFLKFVDVHFGLFTSFCKFFRSC